MINFIQDNNLPSHGKRAKIDNAGTIRVRIGRGTGSYLGPESVAFDFYLNIDTKHKTYNATLEAEHVFPPQKEVTTVTVTSEVLNKLVGLARNKAFMSVKDKDTFHGIDMLDGYDVRISFRTDNGNVYLHSNLLEDTLWDGFIPVGETGIQTPFNELAAIAFDLLGIEPDTVEDEEGE